jgi:hypothetical protein
MRWQLRALAAEFRRAFDENTPENQPRSSGYENIHFGRARAVAS